jgi:hypothetical protein
MRLTRLLRAVTAPLAWLAGPWAAPDPSEAGPVDRRPDGTVAAEHEKRVWVLEAPTHAVAGSLELHRATATPLGWLIEMVAEVDSVQQGRRRAHRMGPALYRVMDERGRELAAWAEEAAGQVA